MFYSTHQDLRYACPGKTCYIKLSHSEPSAGTVSYTAALAIAVWTLRLVIPLILCRERSVAL